MSTRVKLLAILLTLYLFPHSIFAQRITVSAVGDIMAHLDMQQYLLAHEEEYNLLFEPTEHVFKSDDLTFANLETPVNDELEVSGFPQFNAKSSLVTAVRNAGIEVVSLANNHSLDKGEKGVLSTIEAVESNGLLYSGTGRTPALSKRVLFFRSKGLIIGFLSLTFSVNGIYYKEKKGSPAVNLTVLGNKKSLNEYCALIKEAKQHCDVMIVAYHSGKEYVNEPIAIKTEVMKSLAEAGTDVILGHHPHVLQKVEYYERKSGGRCLIAYSLGNFTSAQARYYYYYRSKELHDSLPVKTAESIILQFDIVKWNGTVEVISPRMLPLFNVTYTKEIGNKLYRGYKTYLIEDIKEDRYEFLKKHKNIDKIKGIVEYRMEKIKEIVGLPIVSAN